MQILLCLSLILNIILIKAEIYTPKESIKTLYYAITAHCHVENI